MPSPRDIRRRIRSITQHRADHPGDADGGGVEDAQGPAGRARRAALRRSCCTASSAQATTRAGEFTHPLLEVREVRKRAVILVGTDKGLCGALNSNLFRVAAQFDPATTVFITAGRRAAQFVARTGRQLAAEFAYEDTPDVRRGQGDRRLRPRPVPEAARWTRSRSSPRTSSTR